MFFWVFAIFDFSFLIFCIITYLGWIWCQIHYLLLEIFWGNFQVFQARVSFVKDVKKQEEMWERQHEVAADKIYNMCYEMGGFFLKVFQFSFLISLHFALVLFLICLNFQSNFMNWTGLIQIDLLTMNNTVKCQFPELIYAREKEVIE